MRRFKSCLLILIALWLPLQAAAAVTMPFCRHAAEQAAMEAAHCHEQVADAASSPTAASAAATDGLECDNCTMCHLATAGYLLAATGIVPPLAASILVPKLTPASPSHVPEPPQQPPRRLN